MAELFLWIFSILAKLFLWIISFSYLCGKIAARMLPLYAIHVFHKLSERSRLFIQMKKVLLDAHTHTVASGHAYSSLQEMAKAAADMGLEVLGITEHGPSVPGTCPTLYFKNMFVVPRRMYGIRLLMGCEINILDTKGSLDLTDEQMGWLDIAIAGVHAAWYQAGTKEENTQGLVNVINNHSLAPQRHKTVARDNNLEILRLCKKYEVPTILGSDAHISFQIADYERLYPLLAETDFPDELIMNYWPDKFFDYLGILR